MFKVHVLLCYIVLYGRLFLYQILNWLLMILGFSFFINLLSLLFSLVVLMDHPKMFGLRLQID